MVSTRSTSRSISSSPEPIYSHAALRDSSSHRHGHRHSSDRLSKTRITSMLLYDEREANDLRRMLLSVTEQLKQESQRADDNERRAREAIQRFKAINEARVTAQQDASRANEELRLYKLQLEYAQKEIFKAQEILDSLEAQRHDAETSAAKARSIARKLKEESLMDLAREEGRRIGLQEGLARGRRLVFEQARSTSDHRDSGVILPSELSLADDHDHEADLRSFHRTRTPAVVEPPLDPIGEPMLSFPPSPPAVNSPNPEASPRPQVARPPSGDFKPIVVRDTPSPSHHSDNIIPQDGFIPRADNDSTIRLPPPHGMVRPIAPASSSPRPDRPVSIDGEPLMVPNPGTRLDFVPIMEPESPGSTTISQFELVSEPNGSVSRPSRKKRTSLSVIPETVSGGNTPADHVRSISADPVSRPASSASIPHGQVSLPDSLSRRADTLS
ncbi:hypothetical protein B0F90DRAFT_535712 [Multifurca ochricompacta]|uniref:Uncharacterized protein n=1 Tax=Multifurca ochricompacta TaxID=376703 RepID=A0AAD4QSY2_9AGAM|nr:hypothetical protein B0F90DRAFT_535712 [Multifurca ochricompacta]